jgi:hypothetical protein
MREDAVEEEIVDDMMGYELGSTMIGSIEMFNRE